MHTYAHAYGASSMTKVISLSDKAYGTLKKQKRKNESFSDVVLRLSSDEKGGSILRFSGAWKGDDLDEVFSKVMKDRELSKSRRIEI
jgi:predicted CopG family antitoxin